MDGDVKRTMNMYFALTCTNLKFMKNLLILVPICFEKNTLYKKKKRLKLAFMQITFAFSKKL